MKVAYISNVAFSDVDFSLLYHLQNKVEMDYYIQLYPGETKGAAINIDRVINKDGVLPHSVYPGLGKLANELKRTNIYVFNSSKTRVFSFARLTASYRLFKAIKKGNYDIIHHTWFPDFTLFWFYLFRKKLVLTIHDPLPHSSLKSKTQLLYRRVAMKLCNNFILLNEVQKKDFVDYYHINQCRQRIYSSKLGPYDYLTLYDGYSSSVDETEYILFFGKIFSYKGLKYLLPAMEIVHKHFPSVTLIVAGYGDYDFDISEYQSKSYIKLLHRFIPEEELVQLIKGSLFVVAPYIDATQSGVVMTAYAFSKPCIVTNVGALPEVVRNKENGLVVEPKNVEALSDAISYLLSHKDIIDVFSNKIRHEYKSGESSWNSIAAEMSEIYKMMDTKEH